MVAKDFTAKFYVVGDVLTCPLGKAFRGEFGGHLGCAYSLETARESYSNM